MSIPDLDLSLLLERLRSLTPAIMKGDSERITLKKALKAAFWRLETPWETAIRIVSTQPAVGAVLKVCSDTQLFEKWVTEHGGRQMTTAELARITKMDFRLLERLLRHLSANCILQEPLPGVYELTEFSRSLTASSIGCMIPFLYNTAIPGFENLPRFLESGHYENPDKAGSTNWHHMCGMSRFELLETKPAEVSNFQAVMAANSASKISWVDIFPVDKLLADRRPDKPLFVDVGGGAGHDTERLYAYLNSKISSNDLILQDLPTQIELTKVHESIVKMPHDFFHEQPVIGAAAYYLHSVLHDWTDECAVAILKNLKVVMHPLASRILIHEVIISKNANTETSTLDLHMMMVHSAAERTETQWRGLVEEAGLRVVKIWQPPGSLEGIIEAMKK